MVKEKGRVSARGLDENVVESFKEFVIGRYGKLHTVFGQEIQKAMEAYLENATSTHTHQPNSQLQKSVEEKTERVEEAIQAAGLLNAINNGGSVRPNAVKNILG
jgi:HD superfamily phosphohydrolase